MPTSLVRPHQRPARLLSSPLPCEPGCRRQRGGIVELFSDIDSCAFLVQAQDRRKPAMYHGPVSQARSRIGIEQPLEEWVDPASRSSRRSEVVPVFVEIEVAVPHLSP